MKTRTTILIAITGAFIALSHTPALAGDMKPFKATQTSSYSGSLTEADFPADFYREVRFQCLALDRDGNPLVWSMQSYAGGGNCNVGGKYTSEALAIAILTCRYEIQVWDLQTWTMANGDQLFFKNVGTITLGAPGDPNLLSWSCEIIGGTGRFEGATGSAEAVGIEDAVGAQLVFEGEISTVGAKD